MNIIVDEVTFRYPPDVVALRGVSLKVNTGEMLALLGENGAGKTTLAKHLNGLLRPESGRVKVGDWDTRERTPAELARRVGYAFQNPDDQLFERTVEREVGFGPKNLGLGTHDVERRVERTLDLLGLTEVREVHPYDLHASQRKLVSLAATLAMSPEIVILDEPTTGQDGNGLQRLHAVLQHLEQSGMTVLAISHDVDFCAEHFDRSVLMADGEILADGPTAQVLREKDALDRAAVSPPQLFRLAEGLGIDAYPRSAEEFLEAYRHHREPREPS